MAGWSYTNRKEDIMATTDNSAAVRERVQLLAEVLNARATGQFDAWTTVYVTEGGSLMVASTARTNDDDRPHDLVVVHPAPLNGRHVTALRPTVTPEWLEALNDALDALRSAPRPARTCGYEVSDGNRDDPTPAYCGRRPAHAGEHGDWQQ